MKRIPLGDDDNLRQDDGFGTPAYQSRTKEDLSSEGQNACEVTPDSVAGDDDSSPNEAARRQWRGEQALAIATALQKGAAATLDALQRDDCFDALRISRETDRKIGIIRSQPPPWVRA